MMNSKRFRKSSLLVLSVLAFFCIFCFNFSTTAGGASISDKLLKLFEKEYTPPESLIPAGTKTVSEFQPGAGPVIGNIQMTQGEVYVIHKGQETAYLLKKDNPLFTSDTLVTSKRARVSVRMNDKSVFALAASSKLVIGISLGSLFG